MLRPAARVLLIDREDRILLLRTNLRSDRPLWITPGGGIEPHESAEQAALRELREETGIDGVLGPCVWTRHHIFDFRGTMLDEREHFFVVRLDLPATTTDEHLTDDERDFIHEYRWWAVDEIVASRDWFAPRRLGALLPPILAGDYPRSPIDCGV